MFAKTVINGTIIRVVRLPRWLARAFERVGRLTTGYEISAMTIGHTVLVVQQGNIPRELLWHESVHAKQAERCEPDWGPRWLRRLIGTAIFEAKYVWEYARHGYAHNKYEIEAYASEQNFIYVDEYARTVDPGYLSAADGSK